MRSGTVVLCRRLRQMIEAQQEGGLKEVKELTGLAKDAASVLKTLEERDSGEKQPGGIIEIGKVTMRGRKRKEKNA